MRASILVLATAISLAGVGAASAQGDPPGRFTMSPAEGGGFIRLDTQTGHMALCHRRESTWSCQEMASPPPPSAASGNDIARLKAENQELKSEIRRLEDMMTSQDRSATSRRAERPGGDGFKLPTEQDVDQAMDYLGRMIRKFRDKIKELDDGKGTRL